MSEKSRNQNGNQPQRPADKHTNTGSESGQSKSAVPKPQPSFGIIDEGRFWSLPKRTQNVTNA